MPLHIVGLHAESYKRLKAVTITPDPDGNLVRITGKNGHGKSSVLEAIWAAVAGGEAARAVQMPIHEGDTEASVTLDLGKYIVKKTWKAKDGGKTATSLTVESPDGARYESPQRLLDELLGNRSFDPYAFMRLAPKDQVQTLLDVLGDDLEIDPVELERERKGVFENRTDVGRAVKELEGQLSGYPDADPSLPADEVSARDLLDELSSARAMNESRERGSAELVRRQDQLERAKEALAAAVTAVNEQQEFLDGLPAPVDTAVLTERLENLDQLNTRIHAQKARAYVADRLAERRAKVAAYTERLQAIDREKAEGLAKATAKLPVEGIGIGEAGVTLFGVPFSQASNAEQLRVSTALSMAFHPELRVLRIDNGESLDSDSLRIIQDLAVDNDYQVWLTAVADQPGVGIFIEDGEISA